VSVAVDGQAVNDLISAICARLAGSDGDSCREVIDVLAAVETELHLAGDERCGEVGAARESVERGDLRAAAANLERSFEIMALESAPTCAPRAGSAATVMASLARENYRIVRDSASQDYYAIPTAGGKPLTFGKLVSVLEQLYLEQNERVPPAGAAARVVDLLRTDDTPFEEVVPTPMAASAISDDDRARLLAELETAAGELLTAADVLADLRDELECDGFAGRTDVPELAFLAVNTTLLDVGRGGFVERLASVKVDGPSSSGKNYAVDAALDYLPDEIVVRLTGQSAKALIYGTEPLENKFLYFPEGAGIRDDSDASIFLRSLLSEGELRYEVAVAQQDGPPITQTIVRKGPIGALVTTSAVRLDNDLENRLIRATIDDSKELTAKIIAAHGARAARGSAGRRDRSNWHARHRWLRLHAPIEVRIPYAHAVAAEIRPVAVRLRRDVQTLFALIAAHTALHLPTRERDDDGYLIATETDYTAVCRLIDSLLGANIGELTPAWAPETWEAIPAGPDETITFAALGRKLGIGTDAARDRALKLIETGQLRNLEARPRLPAKLVRGDAITTDSGGFLPDYAGLHIPVETDTPTRSPEAPPETQTESRAQPSGTPPEPEPEPEPALSSARLFGLPSDTAPEPLKPHQYTTNEPCSGDLVDAPAANTDGASEAPHEPSLAQALLDPKLFHALGLHEYGVVLDPASEAERAHAGYPTGDLIDSHHDHKEMT
jgi:hypothetical protein